MRAARRFAGALAESGQLQSVRSIDVHLYGSLALTGKGHGSDKAIILGLIGQSPEVVDPDKADALVARIRDQQQIVLPDGPTIRFVEDEHLHFVPDKTLPRHSNGMRLRASDQRGRSILEKVYYSLGGGFVVDDAEVDAGQSGLDDADLPLPFACGDDLLRLAKETGLSVSSIVLENEKCWRSESAIRETLLQRWSAMQECVERGCRTKGTLPGGLQVVRRAPELYEILHERPEASLRDPLSILDWVDLYALAVSEENAAGGRVVTAPTNGAAGIIPAVMHYYARFCPVANDDGLVRFLLTAGAIGILYKQNASISGAEVGCQGEIGVACSMAAAGLTEVLGGTVPQVEQAAEIAMEHNLGLTCDPVGGLVQVPCIERNAMGAVQAINASRIALRGSGEHRISLDRVIDTMRRTGADMSTKYKETSRGGLAVNVAEC
jgi:L-serine dehydratase